MSSIEPIIFAFYPILLSGAALAWLLAVAVRDGQPHNRPGDPSPEANYIVLRCGDIDVDLVHMMRGSIAVVPGNIVDVGQPLGRVGNSGYTLEPHLHIGARRGGKTSA